MNIECSNLITWQAILDNSDIEFTIEKSEDGVRWKTLTKYNALKSNVLQNFNYKDVSPTAKNYYRVKQKTIANKTSTSNILIANSPCFGNNPIIAVQPNPIQTGNLHLNIQANEATQLQIQVMDISGKIVLNLFHNAIEGSNSIDIPFENLNAGVYTIQTTINGNVYANKIVKVD